MRFCARLRLISAGVDAARPGDSVLSPLYSSRSFRRLLRPLKEEEGPNWRILLPSRLTSTRVRQRLSPRRFPMLLPWITVLRYMRGVRSFKPCFLSIDNARDLVKRRESSYEGKRLLNPTQVRQRLSCYSSVCYAQFNNSTPSLRRRKKVLSPFLAIILKASTVLDWRSKLLEGQPCDGRPDEYAYMRSMIGCFVSLLSRANKGR